MAYLLAHVGFALNTTAVDSIAGVQSASPVMD